MNTNREKNFVSAVVYICNNEDTVYDFLQEIDGVLTDIYEKFEIICINDASTDCSIDIVKQYSKKSNSIITVLNMSYHQGLELSMNAGIDLAIGDFVYEFDSVLLTYPGSLLKDVYDKALEGFDIVSASPEGDSRRTSRLFYRLYNKYSNSQYALQTEAFRIVSRRAINRVNAMAKTVPYRKAVYANCGLKKSMISFHPIASMPVKNRQQNRDYKNTAIDSIILYTDLAFRWSMAFSIMMMAIMVLVVIYTLIIYAKGIPIAGWSSTIVFLSFAFFGLFAILTTMIKYLSIVLKLNFNRINYVVESIEKLR